MFILLRLIIVGFFCLVSTRGISQFSAGAAQMVISPYDTAYIAGHSHNRVFNGINDDIYVKAGIVSDGSTFITLLTYDCIGLLYPQLEEIRTIVSNRIPTFPTDQIVMSSTHTHSGPDVVGLWGPNALTSGVETSYMRFLIDQSVEAIVSAYNQIQPVTISYGQSNHGHDWVYNISEADELDRSLTCIQFKSANGESILTLTNFACHPTFLDAVNDQVSSDYIGGYYAHMDSAIGGTNLFLQGAIGGWVQPEYEEKTVTQAFYRGRELAKDVITTLAQHSPLISDSISFNSKKITLPVANPNFKLLSDLGVLSRPFGDSVSTEIAYFTIGETGFATHPGESSPYMSLVTKEMMINEGPKFILGLGMDALGYILKPSFFDTSAHIPHSEYLCSVSLGIETQNLILDHLDQLTNSNNPNLSLEEKLDPIISEAIDSMAFPGCQVAVAHHGEIVFNKSYGYHTYEHKRPVELHHIYDVASLTKVTTGLPLLMRLVGNGLIDLDAPISAYLPDLNKSNKAELTQREILAHKAQLEPYIVFWQKALRKNGKFKSRTFKNHPHKKYPTQVSEDLYMHRRMRNKMMKLIKKSPLREEKGYRYSGLYFLLLPQLIESTTDGNFLSLLNDEIFDPLGLTRTTYHPLNHIDHSEIVPTEYDSLFRKQLVHGYVHDEAAAMLGTSCNAGLFSNAEELCKLFMMYNNFGSLNGMQMIDSTVMKEFTSYQYETEGNRRGLGFDKPLLVYDEQLSYVAKSASRSSFGHSGFTGTMAWADPEHDLVFIFLSNRVYPSRNQRNIYNLNVRPRIHQVIYDHFLKN